MASLVGHFAQACASCHGAPGLAPRVRALGEAEAKLISEPDAELRFHSGVPG